MISFQDWQKAELKAAKILSAEEMSGKDKLYKLRIDLGSEQRQIVAGLRPYYSKEELEGKIIIVVANLEPARIAGIESQAMLLAARASDGSYKLVTIDNAVEAGTKVE
ncbi:MAG: methionine--tRNA ligase subunit beta [archaeon]